MPSALVLYHYFYPDDVVSAVHFTDLCIGLRERGWDVKVVTSNRGCRDQSKVYPRRSNYAGIDIWRIWRPSFRQSTSAGRLANALWMIAAWSCCAFRRPFTADVLIVGTDPVFSILIAFAWRFARPATRIAHWCFDLYPEAAVADGLLQPRSYLTRALQRTLRSAYGACDLIIDIGSCMRDKLVRYRSSALSLTLPPWALAEPEKPLPTHSEERQSLFGDARLALMYSGNFGRAHSCEDFIALARSLRSDGVRLVFSVRGNQLDSLRSSIPPDDPNVALVPFAAEARLADRLSSADIHLVSLREEWTGSVVPSKLFGALAVGRPVLFAGSLQSAIAQWITTYSLGWVLTRDNLPWVASELKALAECPAKLQDLCSHCHRVYQEHFSKKLILDQMNEALLALLDTNPQPVHEHRSLVDTQIIETGRQAR